MESYHVNAAAVLAAAKKPKNFKLKDDAGRWNTVQIGDVWVETRPGEDVICASMDGRTLAYSIIPSVKRQWYRAKSDMTRLNILAQSSNGELQLRIVARSRIIGVRVSEDEYDRLEADARACHVSLSDYCRHLVTGKQPRVALSDDVQESIGVIRRHLVNYGNAMKGVYQHTPQERRPQFIIEGMEYRQYRQLMAKILTWLDKLINQ